MPLAETNLIASVIKSGGDLLSKASAGGAIVVPRLEVRGSGTGTAFAFNLQLTNVGTSPAFGVQVQLPWQELALRGTEEGDTTCWWERCSPWYLRVPTGLVAQLPPFVRKGAAVLAPAALRRLAAALVPAFIRAWFGRREVFRTKDVGLILLPGETTSLYFGVHEIRKVTNRAPGIKFKTGDIVQLQLLWHNGPPGWKSLFWKPRTTVPLAIHSHAGVAVSAHHKWESGG